MAEMWIDLRSDTVTRPTAAMREAMARAEVGDDVLGDDPTVIALQEKVAALFGKEAACFVPSGTMANGTAIRAHTEPGDEVICHRDSHIIHYETGSPAALSGVMVAPLEGALGQFSPEAMAAAVRPRAHHFAHSKLVIVENTHNRNGGAVWPLERIVAVTTEARRHDLRTHMDGARVWNACVKTGVRPNEYGRHFDTVSCCFSKGLGAPVGSAVVGSAATITRVHRFRKMFGGNMRQAGMLAAAAIYALDHHFERLAEDHANAQWLAERLANIPGVSLAYPVETNMVFVDFAPDLPTAAEVSQRLLSMKIKTLTAGPRRMRLVTHLDVSRAMLDLFVRGVGEAVGAKQMAK